MLSELKCMVATRRGLYVLCYECAWTLGMSGDEAGTGRWQVGPRWAADMDGVRTGRGQK